MARWERDAGGTPIDAAPSFDAARNDVQSTDSDDATAPSDGAGSDDGGATD